MSLPSSEAKRVTKARTPELFLMERKTISTQDDQIKNQCRKFFTFLIYSMYASLLSLPLSLSLSTLSLSIWATRARAIQHYSSWEDRNSVGMGAHDADEV